MRLNAASFALAATLAGGAYAWILSVIDELGNLSGTSAKQMFLHGYDGWSEVIDLNGDDVTKCDIENGATGDCQAGEYHGKIDDANAEGCNNHAHATSATIALPNGDQVKTAQDPRRQEYKLCTGSGLELLARNGWYCDKLVWICAPECTEKYSLGIKGQVDWYSKDKRI